MDQPQPAEAPQPLTALQLAEQRSATETAQILAVVRNIAAQGMLVRFTYAQRLQLFKELIEAAYIFEPQPQEASSVIADATTIVS